MESDMVAPAVTVLMPVYDPPVAMLDMAVRSVLAQTFSDFEFLLIDDGSRDETVQTRLDFWATNDTRVRLRHEPHRGVPQTSNLGLELARGEYIARQDADDWSHPQRLERQVSYLQDHPQVALVSTDTFAHSADGTPLWRLRLPHTPEELRRALWKGNPFVHGSTMFRREQALAVGGYREQLPCSSDYDFLWRLTEARDAVNLDEVLYHYRYTSGSISARRATDQARMYRVARTLAAVRQHGGVEDLQAILADAEDEPGSDSLRAALKQADHFMLAGDFSNAGRAYLRLLAAHPASPLVWGKLFRLAIFRAIPQAREVCFR
jgi:glycosyltransferase involved in cell wall biosynthesis